MLLSSASLPFYFLFPLHSWALCPCLVLPLSLFLSSYSYSYSYFYSSYDEMNDGKCIFICIFVFMDTVEDEAARKYILNEVIVDYFSEIINTIGIKCEGLIKEIGAVHQTLMSQNDHQFNRGLDKIQDLIDDIFDLFYYIQDILLLNIINYNRILIFHFIHFFIIPVILPSISFPSSSASSTSVDSIPVCIPLFFPFPFPFPFLSFPISLLSLFLSSLSSPSPSLHLLYHPSYLLFSFSFFSFPSYPLYVLLIFHSLSLPS